MFKFTSLKSSCATILAVFGLLACLPTQASAQLFDHLKCYKAKDQKTFKKATADIGALQAQFGVSEQCSIKPKAKLFCVPATKTNVLVEEGQDTPFPAEDLVFDRLCYKLKCPKTVISPEEVSDQFGTRQLEKFKVSLLCTPAVKGPSPTTTSTTSTTMPACIDLDLDTYGVGCTNGPDCNDNDQAINPGATEQCNGLDDDCDASIDEDFAGLGDACGVGACTGGVVQCNPGGTGTECSTAGNAIPEQCNLMDDDCNGVVDDGNPGGGQACTTGSPGVCAAGTTQCQSGTLVCAPNSIPSLEFCNGLDDDCDGVVDNGFDTNTDIQNCGSCNVVCPLAANSNPTCSAGSCGLTCLPGFADCNGNPNDGCEIALDSDVNNCGFCGFACAGPEVCSGGVCTAP